MRIPVGNKLVPGEFCYPLLISVSHRLALCAGRVGSARKSSGGCRQVFLVKAGFVQTPADVFWNERTQNTGRSRVTAPADPEPKGWG